MFGNMTSEQRIAKEIADRGGERVLLNLQDEEIAEWKMQALVLSHFRDTGDLAAAAHESAVPFPIVYDWVVRNSLGFKAREAEVRVNLARTLEATLYQQLINGVQKSPGVIRMMLERLDPETWVKKDTEDEPEGLKLLKEARELNRQARVDAEANAAADAELSEKIGQLEESQPDTQEVFAFERLSLKQRRN